MKKQMKSLLPVLVCIVLMFVWIFVAVALTGGREIADFTPADYKFFVGFLAAEAVTVVIMFMFAVKAGKVNKPVSESVPPTRLEKILRRRGVLLLVCAGALGFATFLLGLIAENLSSRNTAAWFFWICAILPVLLAALSVALQTSYFRRLEKKTVAQMQDFVLSHREQAEETARLKLRQLGFIRRLTACLAVFFAVLGVGCGFWGGILTGSNTTFHVPVIFWSALLYLCALTRLRLPTPVALIEDDPYRASEEDYPVIYAIARASAKSQGWEGKIAIRFTDECNAGVRKEGDTCRLYLGVTLLNLLTEEELQAVFCHEFYHLLREENTDIREIRYIDWLRVGGNPHFFNGLAMLPYAFPDGVYALTFDLYRYADTISAETAADRAMTALTDADSAASALVKLKYHDLYEWECGTWDQPCLYQGEEPDNTYLHRRLENIKEKIASRKEVWDALIRREIQSRSATHPAAKVRLAGLGVTGIPVMRYPEANAYSAECEKALSFMEQTICDLLKESYAEDRQEAYLGPAKKVDEWEAAGKPLAAETYAVIEQALRQLGRNLEAEALCCRALEEFTGAAANYAHYMHGCFLLRSYDDAGIGHIYHAMEENSNYIEPGIDMLGEYCCITGNQEELDRYRSRSTDIMQQQKDVYRELGFLRKGDNLQTEQLPEDLLKPLLAYIASVDDGILDKVYLVRKVITDDFFTSAVVLQYKEEADAAGREALEDKMFQYLDTCSDWQFSLFDYESVAKAKVENIPDSCIYPKS